MIRYDPETPRAAMTVAAVAMSALSAAMFVIVPAKLESMSVDASMQTAAREAQQQPASDDDASLAQASETHPLAAKHASARIEPRAGPGTIGMERGY
jgi:hypothetical protein